MTHFAWPDCAYVAEASGTMVSVTHFNRDDDNDYYFDICLEPNSGFVAPFTSGPMEIRNSQSYGPWPNHSIPLFHIEVQDCRYYDGLYSFGGIVDPTNFFARGQPGDLVSVAGDWVVDDNHSTWVEIHEARAIAVTRRFDEADDKVYVAFLSTFFGDQSGQQDYITLDVNIPRPSDPSFSKLSCDWAEDAFQDPSCPIPAGVIPRLIAVDVAGQPAYCRVDLLRDNAVSPIRFGCQFQCDDETFAERFAEHGCGNVMAAAIRATWSDPGDLWLCRSCACEDPSAPGSVITAPVQGCATAGLDEAVAADRQQACEEVCGGTICGAAAPDCAIGVCEGLDEGQATAKLVARSTCDPTQPQPAVRVADAGNYRVTLDPELSWVRIHAAGETATESVNGVLRFNIRGVGFGGTVDFSNAILRPDDFSVAGSEVTDGRIVVAERLFGNFTDEQAFVIPAGIGVFGVRAVVDGQRRGFNATNPEAISGRIDIEARRFDLHIDAVDPEAESDRTLSAELVGLIDNVPPIADAGGPVREEECTSHELTPVVLDAAASADSDAGDAITHYQWFDEARGGLGNEAQVLLSLPLGDSSFFLHVYDRSLGASAVPVTVRVQDTTPPSLDVTPTAFCLWPPNHERTRFSLGAELVARATDTCDSAPVVEIVDVRGSEPDEGVGDGDTRGDATFSPTAFCVRRERSGTGPGRTYFATVRATDASGNTSERTVTVAVPHDRPRGCGGVGTIIAEGIPCE